MRQPRCCLSFRKYSIRPLASEPGARALARRGNRTFLRRPRLADGEYAVSNESHRWLPRNGTVSGFTSRKHYQIPLVLLSSHPENALVWRCQCHSLCLCGIGFTNPSSLIYTCLKLSLALLPKWLFIFQVALRPFGHYCHLQPGAICSIHNVRDKHKSHRCFVFIGKVAPG